MSRSLDAVISTGINAAELKAFWAVDLNFDSPNGLYFWSGLGDLTVDSHTYTGAGELLQISDIRESSDIAAYGATLTLSGIPSDLVALALAEPYQGRKALVKFGVIGASTKTVTVFSGEMDQMTFDHGPETTTISLDVESRFVDLRRARIRRYSHGDQQSRFGSDMFFEFTNRIQNESLEWKG